MLLMIRSSRRHCILEPALIPAEPAHVVLLLTDGLQQSLLTDLVIQHCATDPTIGPGPIEARLLSIGPVRGHVFGH